MTRAYPSTDTAHEPTMDEIQSPFLNGTTLMAVKAVADKYAMQVEFIIRPDGIRIKFIKKFDDGTVSTKSVELTNEQLVMCDFNYINSLLIQTLNGGMNGFGIPKIPNKRTRKLN